jgi:hypothetical protein
MKCDGRGERGVMKMEQDVASGAARGFIGRQPVTVCAQGRNAKPKQPVFVTLRGLSSDLLVGFWSY